MPIPITSPAIERNTPYQSNKKTQVKDTNDSNQNTREEVESSLDNNSKYSLPGNNSINC
jgi:hypothetical protein